MSFAAIDTHNDVVLGVGSIATCKEFVRVACVEAKKNGQSDTPVVTAIEDLSEKYRAMVGAHCKENGIGMDGYADPNLDDKPEYFW